MPTVELQGEPAVITEIGGKLSNNGVSIDPTDTCPGIPVSIAKSDGYFVVRMQEPSGKLIERHVVGLESVVSIIESWVRSDLNAHMLSPPATDVSVQELGVGSVESAQADSGEASPGNEQKVPVAFLDLGLDAGVGFDGSVWFGGALSGLAMLGPIGLGALAGIGIDPAIGGDSELLNTRRMLVGLMAVAEYPFFFERFALRPGIDVGATYVRLTKKFINYDTDGNVENEDEGNSENDDGVEELIEHQGWEFSMGAHLIGALKLKHGFALMILVSVIILPFADTSSFEEHDTGVNGFPRGLTRLGVGLEYGF